MRLASMIVALTIDLVKKVFTTLTRGALRVHIPSVGAPFAARSIARDDVLPSKLRPTYS